MFQLKKEERSYKVLSQQELLHSVITLSVMSNKFCFFFKYSHFFRYCNISYNSCHWKNQKLSGKQTYALTVKIFVENTCREFTLLKIDSIAGIF